MTALKSTYRIITDLNIILEYHEGNLDLESYTKFKQKTFSDKDFRTGLNYFIHFKNINFLTPKEDINKFVDFIKNNAPKLGKRKVAFITRTPSQVVATTMYKTMLADIEQEVAVFSTNENAFNWLISNPLATKKLTEVLAAMKKEIS